MNRRIKKGGKYFLLAANCEFLNPGTKLSYPKWKNIK